MIELARSTILTSMRIIYEFSWKMNKIRMIARIGWLSTINKFPYFKVFLGIIYKLRSSTETLSTCARARNVFIPPPFRFFVSICDKNALLIPVFLLKRLGSFHDIRAIFLQGSALK